MFYIGAVVILLGSGYIGVVTAKRIGQVVWKNREHCDYNPEVPLPDYIEVDNNIQVHPSRVRLYKDGD